MIEVALRFTREAFDLDASFAIPARGVTGLFGPSGCGKTTVLRCIAGLEPGANGVVRVHGEAWQDNGVFVPPHRRAVGYVFQEPRLFPHLSVESNLRYGMRRAPDGGGDFRAMVELLGLGDLLHRKPVRLSGGERQRAAIARALLRNPRVVLMDEPLANLDHRRKQEILPFLKRLHDAVEIPIIYVSHSLDEIIQLCDGLVVLDAGHVVAVGELHDVLLRDDLSLPAGEEAGAVLDGRVEATDSGYELARVVTPAGSLLIPAGHLAVGDALRLRVLARDVSIALSAPGDSSILNVLPAVVALVDPQPGGWVGVQLAVGDARLVARVSRKSAEALGLRPGAAVYAQLKGVAVHGAAILNRS